MLGAVVAAVIAFRITDTWAAPVRQVISRSSSSITFGVDSKSDALQMNGSLKDFSGDILIDPSNIESSRISFSTALSSATLPPHQVMQAILLQSILARVEHKRTSFQSTRIEHRGGKNYLVHGTYSWGNSLKELSLPVEITRASPTMTEIRFKARESFRQQASPSEFAELADSARGSSGWASARLVFMPPKHAS